MAKGIFLSVSLIERLGDQGGDYSVGNPGETAVVDRGADIGIAPSISRKSDPENKGPKKNKFVSRTKAHDPKSTKYLVAEAWGLNNTHLFKMRMRMQDTKHTAFGSLVDLEVAKRWHDDNNDERSSSVKVIDSYQHADATYTAKYLYSTNACRKVYYK